MMPRTAFAVVLALAFAIGAPLPQPTDANVKQAASASDPGRASAPSVTTSEQGAERRRLSNYWKKGQCRNGNQWRKKSSNSWHDCPANTVCEDGRLGCQCAAGFYASSNADSAYPTCSACGSGTVSPVGNEACTACAAGTASNADSSSCSTCHAGTFAGEGATACTTCAAGTASDEGAEACTSYSSMSFDFQPRSECYSDKLNLVGANEGKVATVTAGLDASGDGNGAQQCETACREALATGTDNEAGCCFLNTFNGVCKFFDGAFEASSVVTKDETARQYFAAPMEKYFGTTLSCSGSGAQLQAATHKTCSGDGEITVATLVLDNTDGVDYTKDEQCYDACVRHAKVEGVPGAGCCRANHFNGNCNWYPDEATATSTTRYMTAIDITCA